AQPLNSALRMAARRSDLPSHVLLLLRYGEQRCALDRLGNQLGVRLRNGGDAVLLGMRVVGARQPGAVGLDLFGVSLWPGRRGGIGYLRQLIGVIDDLAPAEPDRKAAGPKNVAEDGLELRCLKPTDHGGA